MCTDSSTVVYKHHYKTSQKSHTMYTYVYIYNIYSHVSLDYSMFIIVKLHRAESHGQICKMDERVMPRVLFSPGVSYRRFGAMPSRDRESIQPILISCNHVQNTFESSLLF